MDGRHIEGEMSLEDVLRVELDVLRQEHRSLDSEIADMEEAARADMISLQRMKKRKLYLKDKIARLEDRLNPDIIA